MSFVSFTHSYELVLLLQITSASSDVCVCAQVGQCVSSVSERAHALAPVCGE